MRKRNSRQRLSTRKGVENADKVMPMYTLWRLCNLTEIWLKPEACGLEEVGREKVLVSNSNEGFSSHHIELTWRPHVHNSPQRGFGQHEHRISLDPPHHRSHRKTSLRCEAVEAPSQDRGKNKSSPAVEKPRGTSLVSTSLKTFFQVWVGEGLL